MPEPIKVNVVSYGGVKPGQVVVGNTMSGGKYLKFDAATATQPYAMGIDRNLTQWDVALPMLENGRNMFYGTGLTAWHVDLPALKNGDAMFNSADLTTFRARLPKLENGQNFISSTLISDFVCDDLGTQGSGLDARAMFYNCPNFRTVTANFAKLVNGENMFLSTSINAESALNVLRTMPDRAADGLEAAPLHLGRRTYYYESEEIAALLGTTAPIAAGTYSCKGWTITVQN